MPEIFCHIIIIMLHGVLFLAVLACAVGCSPNVLTEIISKAVFCLFKKKEAGGQVGAGNKII